jgi:hypothetical protein
MNDKGGARQLLIEIDRDHGVEREMPSLPAARLVRRGGRIRPGELLLPAWCSPDKPRSG